MTFSVCGGRARLWASAQSVTALYAEARATPAGVRKDALPGWPQPLRGPPGQPLHRPAIPIPRLRLRPAEGEGRVAQQGIGKARVPEHKAGKGRRAGRRVRQHEVVPALSREETGRLRRAARPGLVGF